MKLFNDSSRVTMISYNPYSKQPAEIYENEVKRAKKSVENDLKQIDKFWLGEAKAFTKEKWNKISQYSTYHAMKILFTAMVKGMKIPDTICEKFGYNKEFLFDYIINYAEKDDFSRAKTTEMLKQALITNEAGQPIHCIGKIFFTGRMNYLGFNGKCTIDSGTLAKIKKEVTKRECDWVPNTTQTSTFLSNFAFWNQPSKSEESTELQSIARSP